MDSFSQSSSKRNLQIKQKNSLEVLSLSKIVNDDYDDYNLNSIVNNKKYNTYSNSHKSISKELQIKNHANDNSITNIYLRVKENYYDKNMKNEEKMLKFEMKVKEYEENLKKSILPRYLHNITELNPKTKEILMKYKIVIKKMDLLLCFITICVIICAIVDQSYLNSNYSIISNKYILSNLNLIFRYITIILSFLSVIIIYYRYQLLLKSHKLKLGHIAINDNLYDAGYFFMFLFEIVFNIISVPPFDEDVLKIDGSFYIIYNFKSYFNIINNENENKNLVTLYYSISNILTLLILFRSYHFIRIIHTYSYWNTPRAETICELRNSKASVGFGVKAYLKINPFFSMIICFLFVITILGLNIMIFEYYADQIIIQIYSEKDENTFEKIMKLFKNLFNCYWLILVTMTTVGYGDIYPTTYFGRLIAVLACIFGTFTISMLVVFLNNLISFDEVEKVIFNSIVKDNNQTNNNQIFINNKKIILKVLLLRYLLEKKRETSKGKIISLLNEILHDLKIYKIEKIKSFDPILDVDYLVEKIKNIYDLGFGKLNNELGLFKKKKEIFEKSKKNQNNNRLVKKMLVKSVQMVNILKVLSEDKYLPNLKSIDEVYDNHSDLTREIILYNKYRKKYYQPNSTYIETDNTFSSNLNKN